MTPLPMTHYWRIRKWLPDRFAQRCRIITTGAMNSILVEFEDGFRAVTCRYFVRKLPKPDDAITHTPAPS